MAVALAEYKPTLLVDVILDGGTQRVASRDFYDDSGNFYKGTLQEIPGITKALSDLYYGVEETSSVTLMIANSESGIDATWEKIIVTDGDEPRERSVLIQRNDPLDGTSFELRGKITEYKLGPTVEITVETRRDYALETLLPQALVTNDAPWTATAIDIGKPVNLCFGYCRNVPLRNINNDRGNDFYDYLIGYGAIEDLWIDHVNGIGVKRDGVLVNTAEYGANAPDYNDGNVSTVLYAGYAVIRFKREQMSFTGAFHQLTADVKGLKLGGGTAERNFATVIKNILSDGTWGLGESVDVASFVTAAAALPTVSYMCDGAIISQTKSRDVLNDLLFPSRAILTRATDGEWEMDVDVAGASVLNLGDNDGYYNNTQVVNASAMNASEALKNVTVHYAISSVNPDVPFKEITHATGLGIGIDRIYDLSFVMEDDTAKKVVSYTARRSKYSDKTVLLNGGMECRDLSCGKIITLTAPAKSIAAKEYMVERISKGVASFELTCREYSADIYGDEVIVNPTGQTSTQQTVQGPGTLVGQINLGDGTDLSGTITLTSTPGKGDVFIAAGKTDFTTGDNGLILGIDDSDADKVKFYLGDATDYLYWDGANLVVAGGITATTGAIGGWTIGATSISSANITLDSATPSIELGAATDYLTGIGIWMGLSAAVYKLHMGNPAGDHLKWDGTNLTITGTVFVGANITGTVSDTFTVNSDLDDVNAQLILGRTTGGSATLQWNGTYLSIDKDLFTDYRGAETTSTHLGLDIAGLGNITTASKNTFIGNYVGYSITSGYENVGVGYRALYDVTNGRWNVGVGPYAGYNINTGIQNTFLGGYAGNSVTDGSYNIAIGYYTFIYETSGNYNTIVGQGAAGQQNGGFYNAVIGYNACAYNIVGDYNTVMGTEAGKGVINKSFYGNSLFGYQAGLLLETGSYNILIGEFSGNALTTGSYNIVIGYDIDPTANNVSYELNIGDLIYGDLTAASSKAGIDVTPPNIAAKFHIDQKTDDAAIPVLLLDQADVSEEMIEFVSTIGVGNAIEAVGAKALTTTHFIKVTLPGPLVRYIEVGTIA